MRDEKYDLLYFLIVILNYRDTPWSYIFLN